MGNPDQAQRVPARLPVLLTEDGRIKHFFTALVGPSGVFIVTRSPSAPHQDVTLTLTLPDGHLFEAQGVISQIFGPGDAREMGVPPGMDVQFSSPGKIARQRWESLLGLARERVRSGRLPIGWEALDAGPGTVGPGEGPRSSAILYHVVPPTIEKLRELGERVLRPQGIFVRTDDVRGTGTQAIVCAVHPLSGDEFHLLGEVHSTRDDGVWIRFGRIDQRTLDYFHRYIALGIPDDTSQYAEPSTGGGERVAAKWLDNAVTLVSQTGPAGAETPTADEASIELDSDEIEVCGGASMSLDYDSLQTGINPELELSFEAALSDRDAPKPPTDATPEGES